MRKKSRRKYPEKKKSTERQKAGRELQEAKNFMFNWSPSRREQRELDTCTIWRYNGWEFSKITKDIMSQSLEFLRISKSKINKKKTALRNRLLSEVTM